MNKNDINQLSRIYKNYILIENTIQTNQESENKNPLVLMGVEKEAIKELITNQLEKLTVETKTNISILSDFLLSSKTKFVNEGNDYITATDLNPKFTFNFNLKAGGVCPISNIADNTPLYFKPKESNSANHHDYELTVDKLPSVPQEVKISRLKFKFKEDEKNNDLKLENIEFIYYGDYNFDKYEEYDTFLPKVTKIKNLVKNNGIIKAVRLI